MAALFLVVQPVDHLHALQLHNNFLWFASNSRHQNRCRSIRISVGISWWLFAATNKTGVEDEVNRDVIYTFRLVINLYDTENWKFQYYETVARQRFSGIFHHQRMRKIDYLSWYVLSSGNLIFIGCSALVDVIIFSLLTAPLGFDLPITFSFLLH